MSDFSLWRNLRNHSCIVNFSSSTLEEVHLDVFQVAGVQWGIRHVYELRLVVESSLGSVGDCLRPEWMGRSQAHGTFGADFLLRLCHRSWADSLRLFLGSLLEFPLKSIWLHDNLVVAGFISWLWIGGYQRHECQEVHEHSTTNATLTSCEATQEAACCAVHDPGLQIHDTIVGKSVLHEPILTKRSCWPEISEVAWYVLSTHSKLFASTAFPMKWNSGLWPSPSWSRHRKKSWPCWVWWFSFS